MAYDSELWKKRYVERSDLTTELVHLTRSTEDKNSVDILLDILDSKTIRGSTTSSGYIVGNIPAVCFQDAPLNAVGQNCWFEQTFRKDNEWAKKRYDPVGITVRKKDVFKKGGRPVIYDATAEAKGYLPSDQWWRIVNFDLGDDERIVDWSHEREWRIPNELKFEISNVVILLGNNSQVKELINKCNKAGKDYYLKARGITTIESVVC